MANTVEVVINAKDASGAAFKSAAANSKLLNAQIKQTGIAFNQFGNLASTLGQNQLAGLINQVENLTVSKLKLTEALKGSKLAMAAIGTAAVAAGYGIGDWVRQFVPFFNDVDKLEKGASIMERIQAVSNSRLALRDPARGAAAADRNSTASQIGAIQNQFGMFGQRKELTEQENELIFQLQQLQAERETKLEEEKNVTINKALRDSLNERLLMESEFAGATSVEMARFNDLRAEIEKNKVLDDEQKHKIIEDQYRVHNLKLSQIHQAAQEKIVQQEKATRKRQLDQAAFYLDASASIMGSLSTLAGTLGKKQFGLAQALRYGEAVMSTASGIARAFADYMWPYSAVVAATVGAAGAAQIATIASAKAPQAHSGLDYVPQDATYKLKQGEMVLDPGTSDSVRNSVGGGATMVVVNLDSVPILKAIGQASRDGRLQISARAVV
jgi:hypothetical protein